MLIVDVSEARMKPGEVFSQHLTYLPQPGDLDESAKLLEPATVKVEVTYLKGVFWVRVNVCTRFQLSCARCLEPFEYQAETGFSEHYDNAAVPDPREPDQNVVVDDSIDLTEKVRAAIVGSIPMKALCDADCPGLCSRCGALLAEGSCRCSDEEIDPRLEGLAQLLEGYKKKGVE